MARATPSRPQGDDAVAAPKWTRPLWLALAMLASALLAAAALIALPHDPYIRYQQLAKTIQFRSQWVYERIELDPTPIDIAIIGNSRLGAGISGPQLQARLRERLGRPIHVANLSMPQEGRNIHYVIAKRLLARRPEVKLIILSAIEQMPRDGHPAFRDLADAGDVLAAPPIVNRDYLTAVAALPYRQLALFVQSRAPAAFGDATRLDPRRYPGTDFDSTKSFRLPDGRIVDREKTHGAEELAAQRAAKGEGTPRLLPAGAADLEFAVERHYTRRIAALARARGCALIFLRLPSFGDHRAVSDAGFYRRFGTLLDLGALADATDYYADYGHFNRFGTRRATEWLALWLSARLGAAPGRRSPVAAR